MTGEPQATDSVHSLANHLNWLALHHCTCEYGWRSLGRLYGVSFGKGWTRLTTDPRCPHHKETR